MIIVYIDKISEEEVTLSTLENGTDVAQKIDIKGSEDALNRWRTVPMYGYYGHPIDKYSESNSEILKGLLGSDDFQIKEIDDLKSIVINREVIEDDGNTYS